MNKRPAQQSTRVIEGQERPKGLPATIRKIDGRWFGDARAVFEGVQVNFIYFGVNDHVGRGAFQGHTHPFSELFYTLSGSGRTLHSGRSEVCPEGHIFVARPGYAHSSEWSAAPGHPWRGLIIQFDINLESDRLDARSDLRLAQTFAPFFDYFFIRRETSLQLGRPTRSQLRQSAARMLARLRGYPECGSAWIVNFWIELMAMMAVDLRRRAVKAGQGLVIQYSQKERSLMRAKSLLADEAQRDRPLPEIARATGFSTFHFIREFRRFFGVAPAQYRRGVRMERAGKLLIQTDLPVGDVAERAGFAASAAFIKAFRGHFGLSPLRYRLAHAVR